jgi:hypothetical protein
VTGIVNVVVTCTKRKSREVPERMMLRNVSAATVPGRVHRWVKRLKDSPLEAVPVRELYSGDHWSIARDLEGLSNSFRQIRVWVVSAGYGLIRLQDSIKPYSVTFSRPHPDSVTSLPKQDAQPAPAADWWEELTQKDLNHPAPSSVRHLARGFPNDCLLVVASETYLRAIQNDLERALGEVNDPSFLAIISSGTRSLGSLTGQLVSCDARLQGTVGGVRRSLNVRLAQKILKETPRALPTFPVLQKKFQKLLATAPELPRYDRQVLSDDEVKRWIRLQLKRNPTASHTPLLRQLRAEGNACEQKRFRTLFQEIQGAFHGQAK